MLYVWFYERLNVIGKYVKLEICVLESIFRISNEINEEELSIKTRIYNCYLIINRWINL